MMLNMDTIGIIIPAFIVGLLVASIHVPLGLEVLKRGIIFVDLAIAQIAGLGVIIAKLHLSNGHGEGSIYMIQAIALLFALSAAYVFTLTEKHVPKFQEAIIGSSFVIASSVVWLILAAHPQGEKEIEAMLAGQILWVGWEQIAITALVYTALLFVWFSKHIKSQYFYFIFAIAVTISVQLVGVYLVFASLILPAIGVVKCKNKLLTGYIISLIALLSGLLISVLTDLPTGPVLVCTLAVVSFASLAIGGRLQWST